MRALLFSLAVIAAGCAGPGDSRRSASASTPVARETPKLSERLRASRQERERLDTQAMTEVTGTAMH
jgi:hypothetical protein